MNEWLNFITEIFHAFQFLCYLIYTQKKLLFMWSWHYQYTFFSLLYYANRQLDLRHFGVGGNILWENVPPMVAVMKATISHNWGVESYSLPIIFSSPQITINKTSLPKYISLSEWEECRNSFLSLNSGLYLTSLQAILFCQPMSFPEAQKGSVKKKKVFSSHISWI